MNVRKILITRARKKRRQEEDISRNANIIRTLLNVGQDTAKFISLQYLFVKTALNQLKFPLNLLNLSLQIIVVLFDKNYPKKLKIITVASLAFVLLLTCAAWSVAPTMTLALIALAISSNLTMLFYRANKFKLSLDNYRREEASKNQDNQQDTLFTELVSQYRHLKNLVFRREQQEIIMSAEKHLESSLEQYCRLTEKRPTKYKQFLNLINSGTGVALIILRGISAVLLLTVATSMPPLVLPFLLLTFFTNLGDLIRNLHSKYEASSSSEKKLQQKIRLINKLEACYTAPLPTSDYETIFSTLHQHTGQVSRKYMNDSAQPTAHFKKTSTRFFGYDRFPESNPPLPATTTLHL